MKATHLLVLFLSLIVGLPATSFAQRGAATPESDAPLLTLDDAVSMALSHNRLVKNSVLEAQKFDFQLSTAKSRRLPQFQFGALGGELLHSFDFTFPAGAFGTYKNVGPIPGTEAKVHTPARFTTYLTGAFDQPLTQLYKINLGVHVTEVGREIAREDT